MGFFLLNMNHEGGCGLAALKTKNHEGGPAPAQPETKNHEEGAGGGCWSPAQNQEPIPGLICVRGLGVLVQSDSDITPHRDTHVHVHVRTGWAQKEAAGEFSVRL